MNFSFNKLQHGVRPMSAEATERLSAIGRRAFEIAEAAQAEGLQSKVEIDHALFSHNRKRHVRT